MQTLTKIKLVLLLSLFLFVSLGLCETILIIQPTTGGAGGACSEGTTTDVCTTATGQSSLGTAAAGVSFVLSSEEDWYGVALRINDSGGDGYITLRISDDPDLSSGYILEVASFHVTNTNTANYETVPFDDCQILPAGTYYMGVIEVSGDVRWQRYNDNACSTLSVYGRYSAIAGWNMSSSSIWDWNWKRILNGG